MYKNETPFGNSISFNNLNAYISKNKEDYDANSLIAIGNPIVDIIVNIDKDIIEKYGLKQGLTIANNDLTQTFLDELDSRPLVTYAPGGSVMNTLRVCSWCLNMAPPEIGNFKITMLGAVGNDIYKEKIINSLKEENIEPLLETKQEKTSRCCVGVHEKNVYSISDIKASKNLSKEFIEENFNSILNHDILLIEGYYLKENYEVCKYLSEEFNKEEKLIILTLSSTLIIQEIADRIKEIGNMSDIIVGNLQEIETFSGGKSQVLQETLERTHRMLFPKNRLLITTCGKHGAYCSKYNYKNMRLDLILQCFPNFIRNEEIVDFNGAGGAFLGGFLANYLKGNKINRIFNCCQMGNNAANIILKNIGCTFPKNYKFNFD